MIRKPTFRRFFAYIVDLLVISIIVSAFSSLQFLNPKQKEYKEVYSEYQTYVNELSQTNPAEVFSDPKAVDLSYDLSSLGVYSSTISLVVSFLYFGVFQFFTKGRTLGKTLLGIEVISTDKKELRITQTIIRSSIINSLITSSLLIMLVLFLSKDAYLKSSVYVQVLDFALIFVSIGMVIYRDDGVGLHDKLAHTRVVVRGERPEEVSNVKEAKVEEKETRKEEPKKITHKKTTKKKVTKKEDE